MEAAKRPRTILKNLGQFAAFTKRAKKFMRDGDVHAAIDDLISANFFMEQIIMSTLASAIGLLQTNDAALDQTIAQAVTQLQSGGATASQIAAISAVAADLGTQNQTLQSALSSASGTPPAPTPTVPGGAGGN